MKTMDSMTIKDFLKISGRKALIADSVSVGNALIRRGNINDGVKNIDTVVLSPQNIAHELVVAYESMNGNTANMQVLGNDAAVYVFDEVIAEHCPDFIPKDCLTIATVSQIYRDISVIRSFDKTNAYYDSDEKKIVAIRDLIDAYENKLHLNNYYDAPRLLSRAIEILEHLHDDGTGLPLAFYLPWVEDCVIGDLENNKRKGKEERLIELVKAHGRSCHIIEVFPHKEFNDCRQSHDITWNFYRSYGQHNEVKYVADRILEMVNSGEKSFDQINLMFTSGEYENYIAGIFDLKGIPYAMDDCYHAANNDYVQMMLKILGFAESGYRFEDLENIVLSEALSFRGVCKDSRNINPNTGYRKTPGENIGWGRERFEFYLSDPEVIDEMDKAREYALELKNKEKDDSNEEAVELERNEQDKLSKGFFAIFLQELLSIFDDDNSLLTTYERLLEFTSRYTTRGNKEQNIERKDLLKKLRDQLQTFKFVPERRIQENGIRKDGNLDKIAYIKNFLENLTYSRKIGSIAVNVSRFTGFEIIERPANFIIGMGSKQFAVNSNESAIITDKEMQKYLNGANIPFAGDRNIKKQEQFREMLQSMTAGEITLGFSNYNSVELRECAPSVIFMDLLGDYEIGETITYDPVNVDVKIDSKLYLDWVDGIFENLPEGKKERINARKLAITSDTEASMSASDLQVLLACPLKYYYECIRKLSIPTVRKLTGEQWLPPMDRGNLIHRICQHYMQKVMPPASELSSELNEEVFDSVFEEEIKKIETEVPWASDVVKAKETIENKEGAKAFLKRLHKEWTEDAKEKGKKWRILGCELDFGYDDNLIYEDNGEKLKIETVPDEPDSELETYVKYPYSIHFRRGQIDRLDGYVDSDGILNLRIIDYKTGSYDKKVEEISNEIQIQHYVYAMAAFKHIQKQKEIHDSDAKRDGWNIFDEYPDIKGAKIEDAAYDFPFEESEKMRLSVINGDPKKKCNMQEYLQKDDDNAFSWKVEFPDVVRLRLRLTEGLRKKGHIDSIASEIAASISSDKKDGALWTCDCKYCDYKDICRTTCGIDKPQMTLTEETDGE